MLSYLLPCVLAIKKRHTQAKNAYTLHDGKEGSKHDSIEVSGLNQSIVSLRTG